MTKHYRSTARSEQRVTLAIETDQGESDIVYMLVASADALNRKHLKKLVSALKI